MVETVIKELHKKLNEENGFSIFKNKIENKDVIVVLGCTRSGKSTLVNYLIGTRLVSEQQELRRTYKIVKHDENDVGPKIGVGVVSCTKIPKVYSFGKYLLIDLPGFDDNRGEIQDIINSIYISHVKYAARIKFLMVYDLNLILNDNVNQYINYLDQIHTLFKNFEHLKDSVVMVFSKDFQEFSLGEVAEILRLQLLLVDGLQVKTELVSHLVDNMARLAIFKAPEDLGEITNAIDYNIKEAILACPWSNLNINDIGVSVSLESQLLLQEIYNECLSSSLFDDQIERAVIKFKNLLEVSDYIFASTNTELQTSLASISSALRQFRTQKEGNYSNLQDVAVSVKKILNPIITSQKEDCLSQIQKEFEERFQILVDLDNSDLMDKYSRRLFLENYKQSFTTAISTFELLIGKINSEEKTRKANKKSLVLYASVARRAGVASAVGFGIRLASIHPVASLIGTIGTIISTTISAGFTVPTLMQENKIKEMNEKRIAARRRQSRLTSQDMFD